ncbi:MAG: threonylcarbamoyl-AMP synthase [Anaerolineae bacterium]|nr:threonylcarbamoyl-AMP synthase [Anaerolineae bacterium]
MTRLLSIDPLHIDDALIQRAAQVIRKGGLVAFPTETVYGLGANALDSAAVARIFTAKGRPASDPVIVHIGERDQLDQVALNVPPLASRLAERFWPGPLTLVLTRHPSIPAIVSSGMPTVAVRMPSHPVALALLRAAQVPIAAPSANRFSRPSATTAQHVLEDLHGAVDLILDGGPASIGLESTIVDLTGDPPVVLRPGGIPLEDLRTLLPALQVQVRLLREDEDGILAPGMLYKHYSPRAPLLLFDGPHQSVVEAMRRTVLDMHSRGKAVGLLIASGERSSFDDLPALLFDMGGDLAAISSQLFEGMRSLDRQGVDAILVHGYDRVGLGLALWDRLLRAAEGRVIECG